MPLPTRVQEFLQQEALTRFLRYVAVHTTSDESVETVPSTPRQVDLQKILKQELLEIGLEDIELDAFGYLYGALPARRAHRASPIGLLAHVDTSSAVSGENVKPLLHENFDGSPLTFPDDPDLRVTEADSPELKDCLGDTIITASGTTLLGADDKAGIAEIMAALAAFKAFPELDHQEIRIAFTPDEEVGRGTAKIQAERLPVYCYTMDGGAPGELEAECFDAWGAEITFRGISVHPGYAKGKMINAATAAARFLAAMPEHETPEHTEGREGFFHVVAASGTEETAHVKMILRDFEEARNLERMEHLRKLALYFEARHPGMRIDIELKHQYENMRGVFDKHPESVALAAAAIERAGVAVLRKPIRGGTDGSRLSLMGHPTPNLFTGGMLPHSRKEWIAASSLRKAAETIVHLAALWAERPAQA